MSEIEKLIAWLGDVVSVTPNNRLPVHLSSGEAGQLHAEITRLREENARQAAEIEAANAAHRDMAARLARMGEKGAAP